MDDCFNSNLNISMATKTEKPAYAVNKTETKMLQDETKH